MGIFVEKWEDKKYEYCRFKNRGLWFFIALFIITFFFWGYSTQSILISIIAAKLLIILSTITAAESWFQVKAAFKGKKIVREGKITLNPIWKFSKK